MSSRTLDPHRAEAVFADFKPAMSRHEAVLEANRCLYCEDAPCIRACPTAIDIPTFIRKISTDNLHGSARTIFDANILGHSCARVCPVEELCAGACVFNTLHEPPIAIGRLQRHATDRALAEQWTYHSAGADTGRHVALIGAGPASFACAHVLRRFGHRVTIYEKRDVAGGLNTWGVAPYKLRADEALREIEWIMKIGGIEVQYGVDVGTTLSWETLESTHDAVFLGFGLGADGVLAIPGATLPGIEGAVHFIERFKLGKVDLSGVRRACVIGGGNTAVDAVRELRGLGVPEVTMLYRGTEASMPGYAHEWKAGRVESVRARWQVAPKAFIGEEKVVAVELDRLGDDKKPTGMTETIDTDLVLLAIGQEKLGALVGHLPGITLEKGRIVTDDAGQTGRPGWFAGGDCRNGGKEVVNAAAEGQAAARAIHAYLGQKESRA
jgi:dihydropyrimidine dehydrogenase (NAD+) subunit PreT